MELSTTSVLSLFRNLTSNESPSRSNLHAQTLSFWWFHTFPCVRLNAGWKHEAWNLKISSSWLFIARLFRTWQLPDKDDLKEMKGRSEVKVMRRRSPHAARYQSCVLIKSILAWLPSCLGGRKTWEDWNGSNQVVRFPGFHATYLPLIRHSPSPSLIITTPSCDLENSAVA